LSLLWISRGPSYKLTTHCSQPFDPRLNDRVLGWNFRVTGYFLVGDDFTAVDTTSPVGKGREVRARDRRIVPPPHQERHHLLELPLPLATNPRRREQGTATGPSRRHPGRIGRCLAAHQPARRVRFRGREAARFGRSRGAQNSAARGGLKVGVRFSGQMPAATRVSRGRCDGFGTFV
jgi:hypothetical protein